MHRGFIVAIAGLLLACAQSPSTPEVGTGSCVTDFSCPYGEECDGAACGPIAPSLYPNIQLAQGLFRPYLDDNELAWRATHYDLLISGIQADGLRSHNPNLRLFEYVNPRYHQFERGSPTASEWAIAHGYDPEDFYLHYREDVNVPGWESTVIVPGFPPGMVPGWNPGGGGNPASATERSQSRVIGANNGITEPWYFANVDHPGFRGFLVDHLAGLIDGTFYYGSGFATGSVDGVVCDNAIYYPIFGEGLLDHSDEYYAIPMTEDHPFAVSFETLYPHLAEELFDEFGATKDLMPNYGHVFFLDYQNRSAVSVQSTTPWIWAQVWVTETGTSFPTSGSNRCMSYEKDYAKAIVTVVEQTRARGRRLLGARDISNGETGTARAKILTLALYYLVHNPYTYYLYETLGPFQNHVSTWSWNPAVEFDVGVPDRVPAGTLDFQGRAGTREHYLFATGADPYRTDLTYRVFARRFTNALVLVKLLPDGSVIDDRSITTHPLDRSYAVLGADGSLGAAVTEASLRNNEALILIPTN